MEKTMMDSGELEGVVAMPEDFQCLIATRYKEVAEPRGAPELRMR
jgi:hypothetical protein